MFLKELLESSFDYQKTVAIRYPNLSTTEENAQVKRREVGSGELLVEGSDVVIISLGHMDKVAVRGPRNLRKGRGLYLDYRPCFLLNLSIRI